jgi:uncharacterized protein (DUF1697 family)
MKKSVAQGQPIAYVAFLRGINVGGNKLIKMTEVVKAFEKAGFQKVKTLLASGNVLFEAAETDAPALTQKIEALLKKTFGHDIGVLLRRVEDLRKIAAANPYAGIKAGTDYKFYATFLAQKPTGKFKAPYESPQKDFRILGVGEGEVFAATLIAAGADGLFNFTKVLEKEFGKKITTRNWNTVMKILGS